ICGRESAAERDVVVNARRRWPAVRFEIREVAVQGAKAVREVSAALRELDALEEVDVIIVSRGGGSLEDLLPFSDEQLVRLVAGASTPIVSAIGHEVDTPLIDLAADVRASTPTDAAKSVVPDIQAELEQLTLARTRLRTAIRSRLEREQSSLEAIRSRPVLENPSTILAGRADEIRSRIALARTLAGARLDRAQDEIRHLGTQVQALSPLATLERGYSVVQTADGTIVRTPEQTETGQALSVRGAGGRFGVERTAHDPYTPPTACDPLDHPPWTDPQQQPTTEQTAPHPPAEHPPAGASPAPAVEPAVEKELPEDIASLSYEAARDQLVEVVRRLESGQGGLEESISLWERGEMLARRCQQWLDGARERLEDAVAARRPGDSPEQ